MYDTIHEAIDNLGADVALRLWNSYAGSQAADDYIYSSLEELVKITFDDTVNNDAALVRRIVSGKVTNSRAPYWYLDGYANINSADTLAETPFDVGTLTAYVIANPSLIAEYDLGVDEDEDEDE